MARNEEKAMGLLNRWTTFRREHQLGTLRTGRRGLASDCNNLHVALSTRRDLVHEISKHMDQIQNASLGEHRLRELNDEINNLLRIKWHWEKQIRELGGPSQFGDGGNSAGSGGGPGESNDGFVDLRTYKYFGAARNLPQVRELLSKPAARKSKKRKREDILKGITCSYYESIGSPSEDPLSLFEAEICEEKHIASRAFDENMASNNNKGELSPIDEQGVNEFEKLLVKTVNYSSLPFLTPSQREELDTTKIFQTLILDQKKKDLLAKFML